MTRTVANPKELAALMDLMRKNRLTHLEANGIVLEMDPGAFETAKMTEKPKDSDRCICGHHLRFEHSEQGCLRCVGQCGEGDDEG